MIYNYWSFIIINLFIYLLKFYKTFGNFLVTALKIDLFQQYRCPYILNEDDTSNSNLWAKIQMEIIIFIKHVQ